MSRQLTKEFRLAAACCMWPPHPDRERSLEELVHLDIDWSVFSRIIQRHRIAGLVASGLRSYKSSIPADAYETFKQFADMQVRHSMKLAVEACRIVALLEREGIDVAVLKGAPTGVLAYGSLSLRQYKDIDLLIKPDDLRKAAEMLRGDRYSRHEPAENAPAEDVTQWMTREHHFGFFDSGRDLHVELHWRLHPNENLQRLLPVPSSYQRVEVASGMFLPTFETHDLIVYLSVHGARHVWHRLRWLADVHALLQRPDVFISEVRSKARQMQVEQVIDQALALSVALLGAAPSSLRALSIPDRLSVRNALFTMTGEYATREIEDVPFATTRTHISLYLLGRGWRFWRFQLRRDFAFRHGQWSRLPLFLQAVPRILDWISRRLTHKLSQAIQARNRLRPGAKRTSGGRSLVQ